MEFVVQKHIIKDRLHCVGDLFLCAKERTLQCENRKCKRSTSTPHLRVEAPDCDGCSKKNNTKTLDYLIFVGEADTELITSYILLLTSQKFRNEFWIEVRVKSEDVKSKPQRLTPLGLWHP